MSITRSLPRALLAPLRLILAVIVAGILACSVSSAASAQAETQPHTNNGEPPRRKPVLPGRAPARPIGAGRPGEPIHRDPFSARSQPAVPRWLKEVRAQRRALQEQRRAAHQARHDAIDPIGAAKREERQEQVQRRRREVRDFIEHERRLYLNWGPWVTPLVPRPPSLPGVDPIAEGSIGSRNADDVGHDPETRDGTKPLPPSDWDNRWYFHGW